MIHEKILLETLFSTVFIFVQINDNGITPTLAQRFDLSCNVSGASTDTYQWKKDGTVLHETGPTLSMQSLKLSDAGQYTCNVTIDQDVYSDTKDIVFTSKSKKYTLQCYLAFPILSPVPSPVTVITTSDLARPIQAVQSAVNLNCTVVLSDAVNVVVNVNSQWSGPDGFIDANNVTASTSMKTYSSTTQIAQFNRNNSGNYTCTFTLSSTSSSIRSHSNSSTVEVTFGNNSIMEILYK